MAQQSFIIYSKHPKLSSKPRFSIVRAQNTCYWHGKFILIMLVFNLGLNLRALRVYFFLYCDTYTVFSVHSQGCFLDAIFRLITVLGVKSAVISLGAIDGVLIIQYRSKGRARCPPVFLPQTYKMCLNKVYKVLKIKSHLLCENDELPCSMGQETVAHIALLVHLRSIFATCIFWDDRVYSCQI